MSNTNEPNRPSDASKAPSSPAEVGLGLVEQLLDHAKTLANFTPVTGTRSAELLTQAADTLAAQSRLLALAETLAGAVNRYSREVSSSFTGAADRGSVMSASRAFTDAQAEYQTAGKVPCPECEATKRPCDPETGGSGCPTLVEAQAEIRRLESLIGGPARPDEEPAYPNEFADEALYRRHVALTTERDNLRRQLAEVQELLTHAGFVGHHPRGAIKVLTENREDLHRQLTKAQADNATLVEALSKLAALEPLGCICVDDEREIGGRTVHISDLLDGVCVTCTAHMGSQHHLGDRMLEEVAALRKVADDLPEIARCVDVYGTEGERMVLDEMRATLDAIRNREGRR